MESVKRSVVARVSREEEMNGWSTGFLGQGNYSVMLHIELSNSKSNSNVNYGIWVILTCQCRFMHYNKCSPFVTTASNNKILMVG